MADRIAAMKKAMGLPCTLAQAGIFKEDIPVLVAESMSYALMGNNPASMDAAALTVLFEAMA